MDKQIKERGIFFNGEMVRAILDGRKTQTRRVMKVQPRQHNHSAYDVPWGNEPPVYYNLDVGSVDWACKYCGEGVGMDGRSIYRCPFGKVGDRLWVRETWARYNIEETSHDMAYRARTPDDWPMEGRWRPSIHMPRWASRITLEITDIRVERLRAISECDAVKEGAPPAGDLLPNYPGTYLTPKGDFATAKVAFQRLWESIYGQDSWQSNPWVWVVEFKRVETGVL